MSVLTKEAIFGGKKGTYEYLSKELGGIIKYRRAKVRDRMRSRILATENGILQPEKLEAALILICSVEPSFNETDLEQLLDFDSAESKELAGLILYGEKKEINP